MLLFVSHIISFISITVLSFMTHFFHMHFATSAVIIILS